MKAHRHRIVIESVTPEIDGGRFSIKRAVGERVEVEADIYADGHDVIQGVLIFRHASEKKWKEMPLEFLGNDRWRGQFTVTEIGQYRYSLKAWINGFQTWSRDLSKKIDANEDTAVDYVIGARLIEEAISRLPGTHRRLAREWAAELRREDLDADCRRKSALDPERIRILSQVPDRRKSVTYPKDLWVSVERARARFSSWYELFPRSASPEANRHGTLQDCINLLPYVASMGFDVLYLPPLHPIGFTNRRGKDNSPKAGPDDVGSPWAIGAREGGHKSIHPKLGTLEDFSRLIASAGQHNIEIAIDIAFQCSPDHPYVREHPEWFRYRPDGSVQYAENPPKKYRDIYPFDFNCQQWRELWQELKSIFLFWIDRGVRIFRVDNPHTKPFEFWEWMIAEIKKDYPETIFLSEAFTRPKLMYGLGKLGFTQSYTYFTWRNTRQEITQYMQTLTKSDVREFFWPNLWTNTPDILSEYLQYGGRPANMARLVLAATLGTSYGIYGPAFELCENVPREPGSEEYLHSEKYEIRCWDRSRTDSLKDFTKRVNQIRRANPAFQNSLGLRFHENDNEQLICYSRQNEDLSNTVLVVVNLDPHHRQSGWLNLDLASLGFDRDSPYQAHDLLSEARYFWQGPVNYVELDPQMVPAHIFVLRRKLRTEKQFDYYM
jgi:starch synthase (maltosyl-transferring)